VDNIERLIELAVQQGNTRLAEQLTTLATIKAQQTTIYEQQEEEDEYVIVIKDRTIDRKYWLITGAAVAIAISQVMAPGYSKFALPIVDHIDVPFMRSNDK
jgi:hypothetical protein